MLIQHEPTHEPKLLRLPQGLGHFYCQDLTSGKQESLGHGSKAVHRAYSKKTQVNSPSLEEDERRAIREKMSIREQFDPTPKTTALNPSSVID